MRFMDRLSRLLGRHPDSLKTEADRPQNQSEHTAASDKNFVRPPTPDPVASHDAPRSGNSISMGGVSSIDLELMGSEVVECHSFVTNNPRSAGNSRAVTASSEASVEMSEGLSWRDPESDTSEFADNLTSSILDVDTPSGAKDGDNEGIGSGAPEPAQREQRLEATGRTAASLVKIECPGCRAIYEVGRELIPQDGRDMQCSNCSHEWFYSSDESSGIDSSRSSPPVTEQPKKHHSASHDWSKLSGDSDIAPRERVDSSPLTPAEVRVVISGQQEEISSFIASGRLHAVDPKGDSPLHLAARMGKLALCDLLVRAGADPLALNHGRLTPADVALEEGHRLVSQLLYSLSDKSGRTEGIEEQISQPFPDPVALTANETHLPGADVIEASEAVSDPRESGQSSTRTWTTERVVLLRKLWSEGRSANQIANELGETSRGAVLSKLFRLGLLNKPREALDQSVDECIPEPHRSVPSTGISHSEGLGTEPLMDDNREDFEGTPRVASKPEDFAHPSVNVEEAKSDEPQLEIRTEMDPLDDLLRFEAEEEPEAYFGQSIRTNASGKFIALVSSAPSARDGENGDWNLDLSPAQIAGDGIGSNALLSPVEGDEHDFLKVRNRGRKSTRKAVIQTGTQLSIEPDFCLAWAEGVLAKGWYSGDDLDQLIDSCEGNGDPDELRINLERSLELAGLVHDGENPEEAGLWDAKSDVSADDLADIIEVTLSRATRLPGTQRFSMDKSSEQQLLEPMMRAKQELLLGILASKAAVEAILEAVDKIADGSLDPGSFSLRTIIPSRPGHSETSEVMAASEALKSWHISGRVMDGKRRREALTALDALDLSLAYQKALVASLKASEMYLDQAVQLDRLISAYETANERLILEHLPYARRFAARNVEPDEDPEDVFQVAFTGLQRSTRRFDPDRGVRFVIYCAFWMKQALTRWRADEGCSIRVPVHRHEDLAKLDAAIDRLDIRGHGTVSDDDLAIELEWTADQVRQFRRIPRAAEYPDGSDEWDTLLPEPAESDVFGRAETERVMTEILGELPDRQADIIRMRFGIGRESDMTLEEVGQIYGVTRERIRQIEAKALDFLSHPGRIRRLRNLLGYDGGRRSTPSTSTELGEENPDGVRGDGRTMTPWTDERVDRLKRLWGAGMNANEIAKKLGGTSRNAVIGKLSRLGLVEAER
ncbi:sigma-70 family RNA polymerase sigma factor [Paenirhodobacter enshiensis]|uniref:sigma-70 family RNA polymerase sigma factor n=1 Tax=Paenirhodobacter enshiensis TaxID=1105367 RepID=UPI0035AD8683